MARAVDTQLEHALKVRLDFMVFAGFEPCGLTLEAGYWIASVDLMTLDKELQQLQMAADSFSLGLRNDAWFELMHWHPDIHGTGNANARARSACLGFSRQYFDKALAELSAWGQPSQCWFITEECDSGADAIYVHTPNPNRQNFPYPFDEVT